MPRPRMARRAPLAKTAPRTATTTAETASIDPNSDNEDTGAAQAPARRNTRNTRAAASRLSVGEKESLQSGNVSRDAALDRLTNNDVTTTSAPTMEDEDTGSSSLEIGRRTMAATPAQRRDTTGLDLADDSMFGNLDDSFEDGERPQGPRSAESTSLSLSNFKTRSRQSSIIGRNDPPIRPSSRSGTTPGVSSSFNIGLFRRRAREPSILGTARKPRSEATGTAQNSEAESDGELADFEPEAESTPLNIRRRTRQSQGAERESSPEASLKPTTRKRKSQDVADSGGRPEKLSRVESGVQVESGSDSDISELSSPVVNAPTMMQRPVTPTNNNDEEVMAPPASSGSEADDDMWPDIHILAKRRRRPSISTPLRADHLSDVSSPPSLTHSPNFEETRGPRRGRPPGRRQPSPKLTTAALASLLPKRRYKKTSDAFSVGSDDELDASGLGQDDDELSYLDSRTARKRKGRRSAPQNRAASRSDQAYSALKPNKQTAGPSRRSTRRTTVHSYHTSDKENESQDEDDDEDDEDDEEEEESRFVPVPEDTFGSGATPAVDSLTVEELKQAAKKFKEVDKWVLEYEEVVETSSPPDAR